LWKRGHLSSAPLRYPLFGSSGTPFSSIQSRSLPWQSCASADDRPC
jgi:hypothetical protein